LNRITRRFPGALAPSTENNLSHEHLLATSHGGGTTS
jgi:hypothetical protein